MAQSAALLVLPAPKRNGDESDAIRETALLLGQTQNDLHLAERVERALCATGHGALRGVEVTVHERLVILAGRVPSYHLKQIAQTTALAVSEVQHVRNDVVVTGQH